MYQGARAVEEKLLSGLSGLARTVSIEYDVFGRERVSDVLKRRFKTLRAF